MFRVPDFRATGMGRSLIVVLFRRSSVWPPRFLSQFGTFFLEGRGRQPYGLNLKLYPPNPGMPWGNRQPVAPYRAHDLNFLQAFVHVGFLLVGFWVYG